jgi:ferredoxin
MSGRPAVAARIRVNPIACNGYGLCAEILPEMITLDDWGFPMIRDADVPADLRTAAEEVVRVCPRLALRLDLNQPGARRETGRPGR